MKGISGEHAKKFYRGFPPYFCNPTIIVLLPNERVSQQYNHQILSIFSRPLFDIIVGVEIPVKRR